MPRRKKFPNGKPPNLRYVRCCDTCAHVEMRYEGERGCNKYPRALEPDPDNPREDPGARPISVDQSQLCDGYEGLPEESPSAKNSKGGFGLAQAEAAK